MLRIILLSFLTLNKSRKSDQIQTICTLLISDWKLETNSIITKVMRAVSDLAVNGLQNMRNCLRNCLSNESKHAVWLLGINLLLALQVGVNTSPNKNKQTHSKCEHTLTQI